MKQWLSFTTDGAHLFLTFLSSLRLANSVVHNHRNPPPHPPLLHLLLPVLPSEMLLLCPLSLLPPTVLLSRKR